MDKPSFAKIVAAGHKPPTILQNQSPSSNIQKHAVTSSPRENANTVNDSNEHTMPAPDTQPLMLVQNASNGSNESSTTGPEVLLHRAQSKSKQSLDAPAPDGLLAPAVSEENGTQLSSSSDPTKPPSIDGKSVASGTTFALDEKESLRPDDSASLKAVDDEDIFSPPSSGLPGSHVGSDDGMRAFHDQLREISSMEPSRLANTPPSFGASSSQGVLYVPHQAPGIGVLPGESHSTDSATVSADSPPDPKLLEALESPRDRIWVLKLEQDIFDFVKDPKESSLNLPQCNAYHRMLAHKIADYYMLGHLVDDSASAVRLFKTPKCRVPPPLTGITTPSTAASTPPPTAPAMKILRRGDSGPAIANGSNGASKTGSENGASGTDDDGKPKLPASREEREARYEAARLRIMGSAKPSEYAEALKENDESRSSSAAGKKKKQQRSDSEDGFEARSAYSAYYAQPYTSNGFTPTSYGFPAYGEQSGSHTPALSSMNHQLSIDGQHQFPAQTPPTGPWHTEGYPTAADTQNWTQNQQTGYDLSGNFQRAMSFPNPTAQPPNPQAGYNGAYPQQYYGGTQQAWPQQQAMPIQTQPSNVNYGPSQGFQNRPVSSTGQYRDLPSYQYGQLPSQAFPGRPASKLEHPLPGSYKSKHFNPQSQSFVPNQPGAMPFRPFTPQGAASQGGFGSPQAMAVQRQNSAHAHSQSPGLASPQHGSPAPHAAQSTSQPLLHPLPQPVFPQQPSPNLPLPPKPGSNPQSLVEQQPPMPLTQNHSHSPGGSSIAKWGTPASLPAKPPPATESLNAARYPQLQRQPSYNSAAVARVPGGGVPSFGSMPPMAAGYVVNGSGVQGSKRA